MDDKNETEPNLMICLAFLDFGWHKRLVVWFSGLLTLLTIILGCIGNVYSIRALHHVKISKTLAVYLVTLALWDTGLLICALCYYSLDATMRLFGVESLFLAKAPMWIHGLSNTTMTGSIWMVVAIAIVRYGAISNPLKQRIRMGSKSLSKLICTVISVMAIIYCFPANFELKFEHCWKPIKDRKVVSWAQIVPTKLRLDNAYQAVYRVGLNFMLISMAPFLVILILTIRMIVILRHRVERNASMMERRRLQSTSRTSSSSSSQSPAMERQTTTMLLVLVGKFLLCHTLPEILNILEITRGEEIAVKTYFVMLTHLSNYLIIFNSATNFIVYLLWRQNKGCAKTKLNLNLQVITESLEPILSSNEAEILVRTWANLKKKRTTEELGSHLLVRLLETKPNLSIRLGIHADDEMDVTSPEIKRQGSIIGEFIGHVVYLLSENRVADARRLVRNVGRVHYDLGINLTTEMWRQFKRYLVLQALGFRDESFREAQSGRSQNALAFNKFLTFIVAEMKKAFLEEAEKECDIRLELNTSFEVASNNK